MKKFNKSQSGSIPRKVEEKKSRIPEGNNGYNKFAEAFLKGKEAIYIKGIPRICNRCKKLLFKKVDAGIQLYDGFTAPKHGIQEAGEYVVKNITT